MSSMEIQEFQETVWGQYRATGRALPWRLPEADGTFDAYKILVSEVMLQQTQASRVIPKYQEFLERFPTVQALAAAPLAEVLAVWSGLGYNRRAKYLHEAAQALSTKPQPWQLEDLVACKGVGHNTAAAVVVYAYNQPLVFIETNIRTVFIHHFFQDRADIADKELLPFVERAQDTEHPREWYWALMDYGVHLKVTVGNASRASKHYAKQSVFAGSKRQIRGQVLRLLKDQSRSSKQLANAISDERLESVLDDMQREGLISKRRNLFHLG